MWLGKKTVKVWNEHVKEKMCYGEGNVKCGMLKKTKKSVKCRGQTFKEFGLFLSYKGNYSCTNVWYACGHAGFL